MLINQFKPNPMPAIISVNKRHPFQFSQSILALILASFMLGAYYTNNAVAAETPKIKQVDLSKSGPAKPELTAEFIYKYLVGEVAGQRGDFETAGSVFFDLAKSTRDPRLAERAAKVAVFAKMGNLAVPAVRLWSELDPTSSDAQQAMTEMLIATDKLAESEAYIAKLLANKETRADGFLFLNTLLNRSADKKPILGMIQSLAKPYPNLAEAHFAIAQAAWAVGQDKLAMSSLEKAESLKPSWPVAALFKGQLLYTKSPAEAINYYKAFLKKQPRENEVRVSLAKLYLSEKNYPAAKAEFPTILKNAKSAPDGKLAEMTAVIGLMAFQAQDYPTADTYLMQALDSGFKETEQLFIYLGQSASAQNRDAVAKNWFEKVTPGAHFFDAQLNLANVILKTQGINQAIDHLDGINDLTTEQQIIVIQTQASMFSREKRHDEAFALLEKAVNNLPNTTELVYDYALAAERVGKLEIMEKELRKVIAAKPDYAPAYNALGYSLADRNMKLDEALVLIETALSITPNDHYMLDSLGWVHYRKGNLDLALEHLQKAYAMNPDPEIAAHLGEVLWQKGQQDEAKAIWEKALTADPKNEVLLVITNKFKS